MSAYPPGPPSGPPLPLGYRPCRNCFAALPPGTRVCPRCGAATDFVPVAERVNNTGPTFLGIGASLGVCFILPSIISAIFLNAPGANGSYTALQSYGGGIEFVAFFGLLVWSIVLLVRNPRSSPWRAFAFASLITTIVVVGSAVVIVGGLLLVCYAIFRTSSH